MEEGLIQFLVIVAFIVLSMVEGVARQKKKSGGGPQARPKPRPEYTEPYGTADGDELESSDTLVPEELWEELVGISRGNVPVPGERAGRSMTVGRRADPIPRVGDRPDPAEPEIVSYDDAVEEDAYDRAVREGTAPQPLVLYEERTPEPVARPVRVERAASAAGPTRQGRADGLRQLFRTPEDVRRAVLVREVLGPPLGLRGPRD